MDGDFTASSGKLTGSYRERTYHYEILQVDKEDGSTIGESDKDSITNADIGEADRVFFTVTGGHLGGEMAYRWVGGPFPTQGGLEEAIEDMMVYGSP